MVDAAFTVDDHGYMARALQLAARGRNGCHPNPRVGCVLVRDGHIVGEGWHERAGQAHAEVIAIDAAGDQARGARAYVTLEPCCHHGKTPPCTQALVDAGVTSVVAALRDPNPAVSGAGLAALEDAGLSVGAGLMAEQSAALNRGFIKRMTAGRPFVRAKLAVSLDGRTAMADGESQWVTGEASRRDVHGLRASSSAILTGIGTVLADDPSLNVRLAPASAGWRQPLRVVIDSGLRMPAHGRMLSLPGDTLILACRGDDRARDRLEKAGAQVTMLPERGGRVDMAAAMRHLASLEINDVLVEAGPTLQGTLMAGRLVDELVVYLAPHLMGSAGLGMFELPQLERMRDRVGLTVRDRRVVGEDLRIVATPTFHDPDE